MQHLKQIVEYITEQQILESKNGLEDLLLLKGDGDKIAKRLLVDLPQTKIYVPKVHSCFKEAVYSYVNDNKDRFTYKEYKQIARELQISFDTLRMDLNRVGINL